MSELETIQSVLVRTERRRRWQRVWHGFWVGFVVGAATWLATLGLYKLAPIPPVTLELVGWLWAALVLGAMILAGWRRLTPLQTARWVDEREHMQERLSTALEVASAPAGDRWRALVLTDAAARAQRFSLRGFLPLRLPRLARWAVVVLAVAAGLGFVPEYRSKAHQKKVKEAQVIREAGRQLTELVRRQLDNRPPALETTQKALESVRDLGDQLQNARLTRPQALKELASVTDKVREQARELGRDPALQKLREHYRTPSGSTPTSPEAMQKQMDALQEQMGKAAGKADAIDKMKQELGKLQQAAANLPEGNSAQAQEAKEQLSQAMSELARQAEELGLDLSGIEDALKALEGAQIDQLLKDQLARDLEMAAMDLEKMAQIAKAMKNLQNQMKELGKTLAEQLEKGQAPAAIATLERMMRELKKSDLSPEQLAKMLQEVSDAAKPGSEYGEVGELLKKAAQQMQQGQKPEAGESLAAAADELKRLMEQMGECDGLLAALDGLKMAQMCVGNGMGWGLPKSGGRPGFGRGGRPSNRGVGTWGDDDLWMDPEEGERWDNSDVERPDMDPRGTTDRGDGELVDGLNPTRVQGTISPGGGPMPSMTLKGVSIKGASRVEYTEAAAAAQNDAQSALNQDQVPRAYQQAVRDYFDDLKE